MGCIIYVKLNKSGDNMKKILLLACLLLLTGCGSCNFKIKEYWNEKGMVLVREGKYPEALNAFDKVVKLDPNDAQAWWHKGDVLVNLGILSEALFALDKAIALDPKYKEAYYTRGLAYDRKYDLDKAMADLRQEIAKYVN